MEKVTLSEKFAQIQGHWQPGIVGELNGQHVKIAKIKGEFVFHEHKHEDELFYVVKGEMIMHLQDRSVALKEGDLFIVPKGVSHKPEAKEECQIMMFEPVGTLNTGNVQNEKTVANPKAL